MRSKTEVLDNVASRRWSSIRKDGGDGHARPRRVMAATSVSPRQRARREERRRARRSGVRAAVVRARRLVLNNVTYRRWRRRSRVLERVLDVQTTREVARWRSRVVWGLPGAADGTWNSTVTSVTAVYRWQCTCVSVSLEADLYNVVIGNPCGVTKHYRPPSATRAHDQGNTHLAHWIPIWND